MPRRGPAGTARHTGASISVWEREGKALGVPAQAESGAGEALVEKRSGSPQWCPRTARRRRVTWPASRARDKAIAQSAAPPAQRARARRSSGKSRGESACGSAREHRALRSAQRRIERVLENSRSFFHAPDRHPEGQDYRLGARSALSGSPPGSAILPDFW